MSVENLWGEIPKPEDLRTPVSILREQAGILGEVTNNVLEAEVVTQRDQRNIILRLYINAPAMDNYKYLALWVEHGIELYPLTVEDDNRLYNCADEAEFKKGLRVILSSPELRKVISSLIAQSTQV